MLTFEPSAALVKTLVLRTWSELATFAVIFAPRTIVERRSRGIDAGLAAIDADRAPIADTRCGGAVRNVDIAKRWWTRCAQPKFLVDTV